MALHNMMTRHYNVAGHTFAISGRVELFEQMDNLEPFACEGGEPLFSLMEDSGEVPEYTEVYRRKEPYITTIVCGHTASGNDVFKFGNSLFLICSKDYREGRIIMPEYKLKKVFYEALKMMYDLATAGKDTLHVHAAVVSCGGKGYLFLGPSGTGKSTGRTGAGMGFAGQIPNRNAVRFRFFLSTVRRPFSCQGNARETPDGSAEDDERM